jgi:holo-[acyl-carrier-protein] synthase
LESFFDAALLRRAQIARMEGIMIVGTGVDIVETERVRDLVERSGERFLLRWFDDCEISYCLGKESPYLHLAARLAAKEAASKALRLSQIPLCWRDIVVGHGDENAPSLILSGEPLGAAARLGITCLHLSLSHCRSYAIAMVTAEGAR